MRRNGKHLHKGLSRTIRHELRFDRKPRAATRDRFTYTTVKVDAAEARMFLVDGGPLFKQPIKCDRHKALTLVNRLNESRPGDRNAVIESWFDHLSDEKD